VLLQNLINAPSTDNRSKNIIVLKLSPYDLFENISIIVHIIINLMSICDVHQG